MSPIPYLDKPALVNCLPWPALIDALKQIFIADVIEPLRHQHNIKVPGQADASLLLKPAWLEGEFIGVKQVYVFPSNSDKGLAALSSSYLLSCAITGRPLLQVDGDTLTARRTAAASALASHYLSRPNSNRLLMIGAGRLARDLIPAHAAVRPIKHIDVWSRTEASAEKLVSELKQQGWSCRVCQNQSLTQAIGRADIISCATLSTTPIVLGQYLTPGTHLDLVGAFQPQMRETDDEAIRRASVFVDGREAALAEAGDITQAIDSGTLQAESIVAELHSLCRGQHAGRTQLDKSNEQITLFKSVGAAREDLAAAMLAHQTNSQSITDNATQ